MDTELSTADKKRVTRKMRSNLASRIRRKMRTCTRGRAPSVRCADDHKGSNDNHVPLEPR